MRGPFWRRALPPELVDAIIDQLCKDRATLTYCSLVSMQWLHRSRHHLFANIELAAENIQQFFALLDSPIAARTLLPYVQALRFEGDLSCDREMEDAMERGIEYISLLGRANALSLDMFKWDDFDPSLRGAFIRTFRDVKILHLECVSFREVDSASKLFCGLRSLETLRANFVQIPCKAGALDALPVPKTLRTVRILRSVSVLSWLSKRQTTIERVFIREVYTVDIPDVSRFIRSVGTSLKLLYFTPGEDDPDVADAICRDLALTENTSLNSLKFVVMPGFDAQSPWPTTVLSTVQSKLIRDITLAVMPQAYHKVLDALDWSVIDERRELQRVTVWLHEPEMRFNRLRVPITVLTLLPKCRERGTLHLFSSKPFYRSQRPLVHHGFKCYRFDVDELNLRSLFNL